MLLKRIKISSDLSESSFEYASTEMLKPVKMLVVSTALIDVGEHLSHLNKISLYVDTNLKQDEWYIMGQWDGVFSPGA